MNRDTISKDIDEQFINKEPFKCYVTLFLEIGPPPTPPRNANNIEPQWRIQGGFWLPGTPPAMIFFNQGRDTLAGTDLH